MGNAEVTSGGELSFDSQIAGRLQGFRFTPEAVCDADGVKTDAADIANALVQEFDVRAQRFSEAVDSALVLANDGAIRWLGDPVAKIAAGDKLLAPRALILADESLSEAAQQKVQGRVDLWLAAYVLRLLGPLFELEAAAGLEGPARNVAVLLAEALGVLERGRVAQDVKALDQNARGALRKLGVRFGAYYIYMPALVKPATRVLATQLWALRQDGAGAGAGLDEIPQLAASGRTSFVADSAISKETYRVAGFRLCGERAVRVDIVERLADLIRPAVAYRPGPNAGLPPAGAADGDGFVVTGAMTSLTGCSGEQFASVLRSLGFASHLVKGPVLTIVPPSASEALAAEAIQADAGEQTTPATDENQTQPTSEPDAPAPTVLAEAPVIAEIASAAPAGETESPGVAEAEPQSPEPVVDAHSAPASLETANALASGEADLAEPATQSQAATLASGENPAEPAAPIEEPLIEVWRPKPPAQRPRNPRSGAREGSSARPAEGGVERPPRRDGASRRQRYKPAELPATPQSADAALPSEPQEQKPAQESNRLRQGWRGPRRPIDAANKPEGGGRRGGPNRGNGPDDRKSDERRQESAPPPRREPAVNLNSPFAKLLALKSQLEAKGKG
jgi:ATP-dependent RNA helicase SUPV3L1/SUV3